MAVSERIVKLSKGKFYKPENTVFGKLEPNQIQVVKYLLDDNGKTIGYLTGLSIYNQLNLTTQISNTIQIVNMKCILKLKRNSHHLRSKIKKNKRLYNRRLSFLVNARVPYLRTFFILKNVFYFRFVTKVTNSTFLFSHLCV